jgi:hypothetical protein
MHVASTSYRTPGIYPETWLGVRHSWTVGQRNAHAALPADAWFNPMEATGGGHPGAYDVASGLLAHASREATRTLMEYDDLSARYLQCRAGA